MGCALDNVTRGALPQSGRHSKQRPHHHPLTEQATMNSFFPSNLFFPAPPMVAVPFYPLEISYAPAAATSTVFTIGRDVPQQVRAYMNRPKNVLQVLNLAPQDNEPEQGGFIVDETAAQLVLPIRCGKLLTDSSIISTPEWALVPPPAFQPVADSTAAAQHSASGPDLNSEPAPDASLHESPTGKPASSARAAPKKDQVPKQQPKAESSAQWPSQHSVLSCVSDATAQELHRLLFEGDLEARMQHAPKGSQEVVVTLPPELPCGKASISTRLVLHRDLSVDRRPYSSAIYQQLGESIEQRVEGASFNVWVELFKSKKDGSVNAWAKVEWGSKSRG